VSLPETSVRIIEVGPRDGLQNEPATLALDAKLALIKRLALSGVREIEASSFVNPVAVPQLSDADALLPQIDRGLFDQIIALVPNERGYERAVRAGAQTIEVFAAATDEFSRANIRCSVDESFARFEAVIDRAKSDGIAVRGAVSVAFVCPFSGDVKPDVSLRVAQRLIQLGCYEVAICDTVGKASSRQVHALLDLLPIYLPIEQSALHMHDTTGQATDHVRAGYDAGIRAFDSSVGGLGGCPFAPGAPGNVSTESVVRMFDSVGVQTGISVELLSQTGSWIRELLGLPAHA
jgi:hydroxymethylglutaryl-CoA lyase